MLSFKSNSELQNLFCGFSWRFLFVAALVLPAASWADSHADVTDWHHTMIALEKPNHGCFEATHPKNEWVEVDCIAAPDQPFAPTEQSADATGNGRDYAAVVQGNLTTVVGSFEQITGITSLTDKKSKTENSYTLQINTSFFDTPACVGSNCKGWQQFVYSSNGAAGGSLFIQYWLINYDATCPSGWYESGKDCYRNSNQAVSIPATTFADLEDMKISGSAEAGGNDHTTLVVGSTVYAIDPPDNVLDLAGRWTTVEFNIFGNCCLSEAVFNEGSRMDVRTTVLYGSLSAPGCIEAGFTGETNNLNRSATFAALQENYPAIVFTQRNDDRVHEKDCLPVNGSD